MVYSLVDTFLRFFPQFFGTSTLFKYIGWSSSILINYHHSIIVIGGNSMKSLIQIVVGLLLLVGLLYVLTYSSWLWATIRLVQGGLVVMVFFIALGLVLLGASELKG
jgi:hypothetical protein